MDENEVSYTVSSSVFSKIKTEVYSDKEAFLVVFNNLQTTRENREKKKPPVNFACCCQRK